MGLKIRFAFLLILLFLLIAAVVANCSGGSSVAPGIPGDGNDPGPTGDFFEGSDKLKDMDSLGLTLIDVTGDIYTFTYTGNPPDINPGDILTGSARGGYLRTSVSLVDTGTSLIITTLQATIDDALDGARISASIDFANRTNQHAHNTQANSSGYVVPLTDEIIYSDDTTTINFSDGEVIFKPAIDMQMKYDATEGLYYFKAVATG
ncbi:hypothetical protein KKB99_02375, partial [bacterium]|nr:hypothetical protein [bacterium]MBU1024833.1 hypothetical protein [bacterium]